MEHLGADCEVPGTSFAVPATGQGGYNGLDGHVGHVIYVGHFRHVGHDKYVGQVGYVIICGHVVGVWGSRAQRGVGFPYLDAITFF